MRLSLIVAMTRRGVIGRAGTLPWRLSADLKRFKVLTMGHHVILGRKTYESLPGPLPGRTLLVLTRSDESAGSGDPRTTVGETHAQQAGAPAQFLHNLEDALGLAAGDSEVFVIGGGEIYRQTLDRADRLYVTWVEAEVEGDTYFPTWNATEWSLAETSGHPADDRNEHPTTFCIYDRSFNP